MWPFSNGGCVWSSGYCISCILPFAVWVRSCWPCNLWDLIWSSLLPAMTGTNNISIKLHSVCTFEASFCKSITKCNSFTFSVLAERCFWFDNFTNKGKWPIQHSGYEGRDTFIQRHAVLLYSVCRFKKVPPIDLNGLLKIIQHSSENKYSIKFPTPIVNKVDKEMDHCVVFCRVFSFSEITLTIWDWHWFWAAFVEFI